MGSPLLRAGLWPAAVLASLVLGLLAGCRSGGAPGPAGHLGEPPPAAPCDGVTPEWGPDEIWRSLWIYSPGDDAAREEVRLTRDGERARLEVVVDGLPDDSVGASGRTYWLAWDRTGGWRVTSCSSSVSRCKRGTAASGACL